MIRRAEAADARALAEVQVASWHAAYPGLIPAEALASFTVAVREPAWQRILATSAATTWVCQRDGRVIAFGSFGPSREQPDAGEVWALYAHPDAWSSGAGRELMAHGLDFLREGGRSRVIVWVLHGNARAIRFYEAAGFVAGPTRAKDGRQQLEMIRGGPG